MAAQSFTPRDDRFHFAEMGEDWWATETAWFSFHHPQRKLGGWFYSMFRPNIGTVAGGAWVWDDSAHLPWEILYSANYSAQQLSRDQDLDDCQLANGVSIKVLEPCQRYALGYDDGDRFKANLVFDGVMPPEPLTAVGSTFGSAHHFDQFGRVTGEIILHGERIALDCIGMRDRTWGRRPEDRPRQAAYVTGAADAKHGFLAVTNVKPEGDLISYGFLRRDGETVSLAGGERILERDPQEHWVTRITIKAHDAKGREMTATGVPISRVILNRHTFIDVNSLIRWDLDGVVAYGEDQDMWPVHRWARLKRQRSA
jgi:hypothetical protein